MQLTSHSDYALRLLIYLMTHGQRKISTREVADAYGISLNHLIKVAKTLTKAGWLVSARGAAGGLVLAAHTPDVRLGDIVRETESSWEIAECFNAKGNTCLITGICRLKPVLYRARKAFFDVLDSVTVRDLAHQSEEIEAALALPRIAPGRAGPGL
jgi:Rrf2 family nitric oxide-sensitive transcriptional repressor